MKFEIIKGNTVKEALQKVFSKELRPATIQEIWKLREEKKIPNSYYDTGTLWHKGDFRQVKKEDVDRIEEIYSEGGRVLFLGSDILGLYGNGNLSNVARFVGVKK